MIFNPNNTYNGLAIELKIKPNKPSENQKKWLKKLESMNWKSCVCYSLDEVIKTVEEYVSNR